MRDFLYEDKLAATQLIMDNFKAQGTVRMEEPMENNRIYMYLPYSR